MRNGSENVAVDVNVDVDVASLSMPIRLRNEVARAVRIQLLRLVRRAIVNREVYKKDCRGIAGVDNSELEEEGKKRKKDGRHRIETRATRKPWVLQGRKHFTKAVALRGFEAGAGSCSTAHGSPLSGCSGPRCAKRQPTRPTNYVAQCMCWPCW